jgi:hypothetical protein
VSAIHHLVCLGGLKWTATCPVEKGHACFLSKTQFSKNNWGGRRNEIDDFYYVYVYTYVYTLYTALYTYSM